jgi:hypothetical protein
MKRKEIIVYEHKKGVRAVKYNKKPQTTIEPSKPRNPVAKNASSAIGGGAAGAHTDKKKAAKSGEVKHKAKALDMAESGRYGSRNPDLMNPNDYDRYQQDQMDYDKRAFKRAELQHELGHEDDPDFERKQRQQAMDRDRGPWYLKVNGKILRVKGEPKVFDWKNGATKYGQAILKNKPELNGKIMLTKNGEDDVAEAGQEVGTISKVDPMTKKATVTKSDGSSMEIDSSALKPTPDGKMQMDVPDTDDMKSGTKVVSTAEASEVPPTDSSSPIPGDNDHDEISKLLVKRLRRLAGL